jgi:hypothetical protein
MRKVAFVSHCPGHRNSKGELAEWCVKSHETGKIISSHKSEEAAKKHLQDMHAHSGSKRASQASDLHSAIEIFEGLIDDMQEMGYSAKMVKEREALEFLKKLEIYLQKGSPQALQPGVTPEEDREPESAFPKQYEDEQNDNWEREHQGSKTKTAFVEFLRNHKDNMGRPKPWVIRNWRNGQIIGEFTTKEEAEMKAPRLEQKFQASLLQKKAIPAAMAVNDAGGDVEASEGLGRRPDYDSPKKALLVVVKSGIKVKNAAQKRPLYVTGVEYTPGNALKIAKFGFNADRKKAMWFNPATAANVVEQLNGPAFSVKAQAENLG